MGRIKDLFGKIFSGSGNEADYLHKNSLVFHTYFDIVTDLVNECEPLQEGIVPLQIHNFISSFDCSIMVSIYYESIVEGYKDGK